MRKLIIMGAGGRDFHNFNVAFRDDPDTEVVAFTAAQIPGIDERVYPPSLAGPLYPNGIPIRPEAELARADPRVRRRRGRPRLLGPLARDGDAQGVDRARRRRRLPPARPGRDDDPSSEAGRRGLRDAHRLRQEPDEPPGRPGAARRRAEGRARPAPDALRRPRGDARAALRDARGHRRLAPDDRGARGVRGPGEDGDGHVRRRRLRGDPAVRPRRRPTSSSGTAATTTSRSSRPTC